MVRTQRHGNYDVATGSNRSGQFFAIAFGRNNECDVIEAGHHTEKEALDAIWNKIDEHTPTGGV